MTDNRRMSLADGLLPYRSQPLDRPTHTWLDGWIARTRYRGVTVTLESLVDMFDDWRLLLYKNYGGDEVLRLSDPQRRTSLSQHLLCALIYDKDCCAQ